MHFRFGWWKGDFLQIRPYKLKSWLKNIARAFQITPVLESAKPMHYSLRDLQGHLFVDQTIEQQKLLPAFQGSPCVLPQTWCFWCSQPQMVDRPHMGDWGFMRTKSISHHGMKP